MGVLKESDDWVGVRLLAPMFTGQGPLTNLAGFRGSLGTSAQ